MNREHKRLQKKAGGDKPIDRRAMAQRRASTKRATPRQYLAGVRSELRKVKWPSWDQVLNSTIIVVIAIVIITSFIWLTDLGASKLVFYLFQNKT